MAESDGAALNAASVRYEDARRVWRLAAAVRLEAADLRNRAKRLDKEAVRLDSLAAGIQDGRSLEETLGV